jgi:hypothetical protein
MLNSCEPSTAGSRALPSSWGMLPAAAPTFSGEAEPSVGRPLSEEYWPLKKSAARNVRMTFGG